MSEPERLANSMMGKLERRTSGTLGNRNCCFINQDVMTSIIIWLHSLTCFVIKSCFGLPNNPISGWHWIVPPPPRHGAFATTPKSRQTHSLHNKWYCSSFLKGEDEQRIVSGSCGVSRAHTRAHKAAAGWQTFADKHLEFRHTSPRRLTRTRRPGSGDHPDCPEYQEGGSMLEKEGRDAPTPSINPVRPVTSTSLNILFRDFKCYVLNPVSDLLGKTRQTGSFYKEQKTSVGRQTRE